MVCLNSKTYNENNDTLKMALKGSNRNIVEHRDKYKSVLQTKNLTRVLIVDSV